MGRRIVTTRHQATTTTADVDGYFDRVLKYIPADVVGAWVTVTGIVEDADDALKDAILWTCFAIGIALTAAWTFRCTRRPELPPAWAQVAISTIAFGVWVFALGGPFEQITNDKHWLGSLALIAFSLGVGLVVPDE